MNRMELCPICKTKAKTGDWHPFCFDCTRCGKYQIDRVTKGYLNLLLDTEEKRIMLSHAIRKLQSNEKEPPLLDIKFVRDVTEKPFPTPQEQIKNLILWLGDNTQTFGKDIRTSISTLQLEMSSLNADAVKLIIKRLVKEGMIITTAEAGAWGEEHLTLNLDINGWDLYQQLRFVSDSSDTGKLLNYMINSQTFPYSDPEEIKKAFSWDEEQFTKIFRLLKDVGLIDDKYADDKPNTIWVTEKGCDAVKIENKFLPNFSVGGNIINSNVISGNNNAIISFTKPPEGKSKRKS